MNAKIFINYRREDTRHAAGRLYDHLITRFGKDQVFMDIDQIEPGEDFVEVINRKVGTCDIAIVAIGPNWLRATDSSGKRRLDDEEDFVRMEIVAALQRNIRVIPVLVDRAQMPRKQDLPETLAPLSRRNAIELSETRFHADVNRLIEAIEKSFAVAEKKVELSATPAPPPAQPAQKPKRGWWPSSLRAPPRREVITSPRLYVGNLSFDVTDSDLFELFNGFGPVQKAEVQKYSHNQRSKGFAFVQMQTIEEAKRAVEELHDKEFVGRRLVVSGAKSDQHQPR